jgi:hypothetical protein
LDKDGDGHITYPEFAEKINLNDYQKKSHPYVITEQRFIEKIMNEWFIYSGEERQRIHSIIIEFDENGDKLF